MSNIIISAEAPREIIEYIKSLGHEVYSLTGRGVLPPVRCHADMFICRLTEDAIISALEDELTPGYPQETAFNALVMQNKLFCRTASASPRLLDAARALGMSVIPVKQGYAACSVCRVSDNAAITADSGMAAALEGAGIDVLRIRPGHILLPGYDTGFIGGASALLDGRLIFFGNAAGHPDWRQMEQFIAARGIEYKIFPTLPLTDLGGLVQADNVGDLMQNKPAFSLIKPL